MVPGPRAPRPTAPGAARRERHGTGGVPVRLRSGARAPRSSAARPDRAVARRYEGFYIFTRSPRRLPTVEVAANVPRFVDRAAGTPDRHRVSSSIVMAHTDTPGVMSAVCRALSRPWSVDGKAGACGARREPASGPVSLGGRRRPGAPSPLPGRVLAGTRLATNRSNVLTS